MILPGDAGHRHPPTRSRRARRRRRHALHAQRLLRTWMAPERAQGAASGTADPDPLLEDGMPSWLEPVEPAEPVDPRTWLDAWPGTDVEEPEPAPVPAAAPPEPAPSDDPVPSWLESLEPLELDEPVEELAWLDPPPVDEATPTVEAGRPDEPLDEPIHKPLEEPIDEPLDERPVADERPAVPARLRPEPPAYDVPDPVGPAREPVGSTMTLTETAFPGLDDVDADQGHGPAAPPAPAARHSALRNTVEWVLIIGAALMAALVIKTYLLQAFYIPSGSMEPTLEVQDRVLVNKLSYRLHDVNRGDVVVFERPPEDTGQIRDLIKRVIALPGDTVEGRAGIVFVNGKPLLEPYLPQGTVTSQFGPKEVPPKHVWVMGDNRGNSSDSRVFGPISESRIVGRAFIRVWPLSALGLL